MKHHLFFVAIGAVTVASITAAVTHHAPPADEVILAHGADHLPNQTASDWVTYADQVVVVTATGEKEIPPADTEIQRGEGLILRHVTLRVDDVLWSRQGAAQPVPKSIDWPAFGWRFHGGSTSNRTMMAGDDKPRIETGHTYIMAIEWEEARCPADDDPVPARWRGLGSDSTIPFDDSVIGNGEMEGQEQTADQARQGLSPDDPNPSLEDEMAGQGSDALVDELSAAKPETKQQFGPEPASCS